MPLNIAYQQNTIVDQWSSSPSRWQAYDKPDRGLLYEKAMNFLDWKYIGL